MKVTPKDSTSNSGDARDVTTRKQIRGSGLLLTGRCVSLVLNFATQVLIVRSLSKSDFGAWAYCLSLIALFQAFSSLGLQRAITRFLPIYHEQEDYGKMFGTILLVIISIIFTGMLFVTGVHLAPEAIALLMKDNSEVIKILLIMIFIVPAQAIDGILIGIFASFSKSRVIFYRRYILAPALKLLVVLALIYYESSVTFLAYGYVTVSIIGIVIFLYMLIRLLRHEGLTQHFNLKTVNIPAKVIFAFTLPLLTTDIVQVVMHSSSALLLGFFQTAEEVALYRVIIPLAHINTMVLSSFGLLYTPMVARLFARDDYAAINDVYWQTAVWLAVLSFPIFALTFVSAKPLTLLLYGERYSDSWIYLQIMAGAYYFSVLLGFNSLTLTVLGKVRYVVIINSIALVINLTLNLLFIPKYGALGAAIGTGSSIVCHNILNQLGLKMAGINDFDKQYLPLYFVIIITTFLLFMVQFSVTDSIYLLVALIVASSLLIIRISAQRLKIEETFPELMKFSLMRMLLRH